MNEKKYFNLIAKGILPRPQYALGLFLAAAVAKQQGIQKFSVIEFGCWEGEGLIDLEHYSYEIEDATAGRQTRTCFQSVSPDVAN